MPSLQFKPLTRKLVVLLTILTLAACEPQNKKTLDMTRVKRIEFTSNRPDTDGCADPADPSKSLPVGTKYCLNPTGNPGDGYLYVCKTDGSWNRTDEKCP